MNRRRRYTGSNPSLRRVLYRAHLGVALVAVFTAGLAVTLVGLLTLRAYADPNQQLIARSISYTVEAAVVFGDAQAAEVPGADRLQRRGLQRHRLRPPGTDPGQLASGKHRAAAPAGTATGALAAQRADRTTDPATARRSVRWR